MLLFPVGYLLREIPFSFEATTKIILLPMCNNAIFGKGVTFKGIPLNSNNSTPTGCDSFKPRHGIGNIVKDKKKLFKFLLPLASADETRTKSSKLRSHVFPGLEVPILRLKEFRWHHLRLSFRTYFFIYVSENDFHTEPGEQFLHQWQVVNEWQKEPFSIPLRGHCEKILKSPFHDVCSNTNCK